MVDTENESRINRMVMVGCYGIANIDSGAVHWFIGVSVVLLFFDHVSLNETKLHCIRLLKQYGTLGRLD